MKRQLGLAVMALLVLMTGTALASGIPSSRNQTVIPDQRYGPGGQDMDSSYFYDYLSDYGTWVDHPEYQYVWVPYESESLWHPFSRGRWAWTEYGWTWVSSYEWGWIPFHYGRWSWASDLGWFWVPDTVWGPAWVSWRWSNSHIGWAPLPPRYRYTPGRGLYTDSVDLNDDAWLFVDGRYFDDQDLERYILPQSQNLDFIRGTAFRTQLTDRGGLIINDGLSLSQVEKISGRRIYNYQLGYADRPGMSEFGSSQVLMYRPQVRYRPPTRPRELLSRDRFGREWPAIRSQRYRGYNRPIAPLPYGQEMDNAYFYEYLSYYGTWVFHPEFQYIWVPYEAERSWHPFGRGRWVWTEYGWTWVSNYEWGWIPFHYGRWAWEPRLGWFWVPDTVWGPSWVSWRWSDSHIGWAPLPPRYRYTQGYGLDISYMNLDEAYWIFVEALHFIENEVNRYILPRNNYSQYLHRTTFRAHLSDRGGHVYNEGLRLSDVERITRRRVTTFQIKNADRPGSARVGTNDVVLYRPPVKFKSATVPKSYLTREKFEKDWTTIRTRGIEGQKKVITTRESQAQITERHRVELRNIEQVHQQEILNSQRQFDSKLSATRSEAERNRLRSEKDRTIKELKLHHNEQINTLKKKHQDEVKGVRDKDAKEKDGPNNR